MTSPKSILLHLDSSTRTATRVEVARKLADAFGARVTGMPCTLSALVRYPSALEGAAEAMAIMLALDKQSRDKAYATFMASGGDSARMHWVEPMNDAPWGFNRRALYADLLILAQRDGDSAYAGELPAEFVSTVLVESGRPALVLPYIATGSVDPVGRTVLVAWKETREAARAVSAALPWLRGAARVHAVCYGNAAESQLRSLQVYLDSHGVTAVVQAGVQVRGDDAGDAGAHLLSLAADVGAELLVMGCYGHSRAREWVLGGVTRTILQSMTLPVLMSH
ncbi:MAG: putative universal stress protein [Variovorax sp.]|nr:putative universal stress protein [Variovorax sp.]